MAVGEALGWPFLAQPLNRWLSNQLERPVNLASADAPASLGKTAFSIRFIGGVRLQSSQIEVGAPGWSTAGPTLRARDVLLELRYVDLWRAYRGQPLHIELLRAQELDAQLERLADGRASWQFGPACCARRHGRSPRAADFGHVTLGAGTLRYRDEPLDIDVDHSPQPGRCRRRRIAPADAGHRHLARPAAEGRTAQFGHPFDGRRGHARGAAAEPEGQRGPRQPAVRRPGPGCRSAGRPERPLPTERAVAGRRG